MNQGKSSKKLATTVTPATPADAPKMAKGGKGGKGKAPPKMMIPLREPANEDKNVRGSQSARAGL